MVERLVEEDGEEEEEDDDDDDDEQNSLNRVSGFWDEFEEGDN